MKCVNMKRKLIAICAIFVVSVLLVIGLSYFGKRVTSITYDKETGAETSRVFYNEIDMDLLKTHSVTFGVIDIIAISTVLLWKRKAQGS
jgi:CHASE3 domain sensor protein